LIEQKELNKQGKNISNNFGIASGAPWAKKITTINRDTITNVIKKTIAIWLINILLFNKGISIVHFISLFHLVRSHFISFCYQF